ncbi:hypothetical protein P4S67_06285 [Pseudoalteromonas sp. B137]
MAHVSVKKYSQVRASNIAEMAPYEQINLIFSNIIGRLAATKGFIERKEIQKKEKTFRPVFYYLVLYKTHLI